MAEVEVSRVGTQRKRDGSEVRKVAETSAFKKHASASLDRHDSASLDKHDSTSLERAIDRWAAAKLYRSRHAAGPKRWLIEFTVFVLKQAWACVFGAAFLAVLVAAKLWWPDPNAANAPGSPAASISHNDFLVIAAVVIQVLMIAFKLETGRELWVIILFHLVGTVMELFKTSVGSWTYDDGGVLRIGAVPLYSGFMYAAVGSYMVRVYKLFDLRFRRYPPRWLTAVLAAAIYANFFTHHYMVDLRWILVAAVVVMFGPCVMYLKNHRIRPFRPVPLLPVFVGTAFFIWVAENIATWAGAWFYPSQTDGWHPVSLQKLVAWLLLMIISVVLVTFVYPPTSAKKPIR